MDSLFFLIAAGAAAAPAGEISLAFDLAVFTHPEAWIALLTLTVLELVLGIDNVIFISILAGRLPEAERPKARQMGLMLAMVMRIGLLFSISWVISLKDPFLNLGFIELSVRDLILLAGGLFLIYKATSEIHDKLEGEEGHASAKVSATFGAVIAQIVVLDIVFSLDSVITAVGMASQIAVMVVAVVLAVVFMLFFAGPVSSFVERHPTVKMLALSFLLLIGVSLVADAFHHHIEKGYIYAAMGFSVLVEFLNLLARKKKAKPVVLHSAYVAGPPAEPSAKT